MSFALILAACGGGDDGGGDDGGPGVDAPAFTGCGTGPPCDTATQMCVVSSPVGPGMTYACVAVPAGCDDDRTCGCAGPTLCTGAFDTCNAHPDPNTIVCECPQCQ